MTRTLEVEEDGTLTLPAELLGEAKPHTRYQVEAQGEKLILRPETPPAPPRKPRRKKTLTPEEWKQEWDALAEKVGRAWKSEESAVEVVSEMRR